VQGNQGMKDDKGEALADGTVLNAFLLSAAGFNRRR
jgi:hypothetical protein